MPEAEDKQLKKLCGISTLRRMLILLVSGALSGALLACLITSTQWLKNGLPHLEIPVGRDNNGMVRYIDVTGSEYVSFLVQSMLNDIEVGLFLGLLGGVVMAVVSLYWRGVARLSGATLFWAGLGGSGGLLLEIVVDPGNAAIAKVVFLTIGGAIIGAAFGAVLTILARLLHQIGGSRKDCRNS